MDAASCPRRIGRVEFDLDPRVLAFKLGPEEYGIEILRVQEIRSNEEPTRIANAPPFMKGVVNLRGVIVRIVDMRLKSNLETACYDSFSVVVVLNSVQANLGDIVNDNNVEIKLNNHVAGAVHVVSRVIRTAALLDDKPTSTVNWSRSMTGVVGAIRRVTDIMGEIKRGQH